MELCLYQGKAMSHQRMGRIEGMLHMMLPEIEQVPKIQWHGTKIPRRLWNSIKSFMTWTQNEYNSEAQIRLYYNDHTNRWRALAWPQYIGTGLFSQEIKDHENKAALFQYIDVAKGWYEFGTVHHHCTAGAFQSGTDHKDEIGRPGIHITLGHILSDELAIHARFVTKKIQYDVDITEWVDGDLTKSLSRFPKIWADQCFKKPVEVRRPWQSQYDTRGRAALGLGSASWRDADTRTWESDKRRPWDVEDDLDMPPKIKLPVTGGERFDKREGDVAASLDKMSQEWRSQLEAHIEAVYDDIRAEIEELKYITGMKPLEEGYWEAFFEEALENAADVLREASYQVLEEELEEQTEEDTEFLGSIYGP